jgi:hypothetical protein
MCCIVSSTWCNNTYILEISTTFEYFLQKDTMEIMTRPIIYWYMALTWFVPQLYMSTINCITHVKKSRKAMKSFSVIMQPLSSGGANISKE